MSNVIDLNEHRKKHRKAEHPNVPATTSICTHCLADAAASSAQAYEHLWRVWLEQHPNDVYAAIMVRTFNDEWDAINNNTPTDIEDLLQKRADATEAWRAINEMTSPDSLTQALMNAIDCYETLWSL